MKNIKSLLALIMALCLVMCLSVPVLATEVEPSDTTATTAATEEIADTTAATEATTEAVTEPHDHDHDHDHTDETTGEKETNPVIKVIRIVLIVLEVIVSLGLIVVVLAQSGKESGLSGALTGNSDSYMNKNGKGGLDKTLAKATKWVALAWVLLTLALGLVSLL